MLKLQQYQFTVSYKKGKELYVADTLLRAALNDPTSIDVQQAEVFRLELAEMDLKPNQVTADALQRIRSETSKDPALAALYETVMNGWPDERKRVPEQLRLYWGYRDEISAYDGVLFNSQQVIVPTSLRPEMLKKIHKAHQGPYSSMRRARESLFWPGMLAAIRESCLACGTCAQYLAERPVEPTLSHDVPSRPWSKISVDLFQLDGKHYFVTVDYYSDYFELDSLRSTTASVPYASYETKFCSSWDPGFHHIPSHRHAL